MALRTHFEQTKIGCPGIAEFTVQRTEALFDHITGDLCKNPQTPLNSHQDI